MIQSRYLALFFTICLTACSPGLETKEETDDLGFRTEYQVDPETGLKEGFLREYDPQGNLSVEEQYSNGQLNGARKVFAANGQVLAEENLVMGQYEGLHKSYTEDGHLEMAGAYSDGAMNGRWYLYYPDGTVKAEITFTDNEQDGPVRQWYPDGTPELSGRYAPGGDFVGDLIRYDSAGSLERVLNCAANQGCRTYWTPDSTGQLPIAEVDMTRPEGV